MALKSARKENSVEKEKVSYKLPGLKWLEILCAVVD